uniref:Fe2OG dioxygenase domain-containing protein n=1 Tax=Alexandrium monilatum TaxID=311494 RepID=A0A7S4UEP7_9DINO
MQPPRRWGRGAATRAVGQEVWRAWESTGDTWAEGDWVEGSSWQAAGGWTSYTGQAGKTDGAAQVGGISSGRSTSSAAQPPTHWRGWGSGEEVRREDAAGADAEEPGVGRGAPPGAGGRGRGRQASSRWRPVEAGGLAPRAADAGAGAGRPELLLPSAPQEIPLKGAEVFLFPDCLSQADSQELFAELDAHASWQKRPIVLRDRETGKRVEALEGRPTISFSLPPGKEYSYSGSFRVAEEFPACVLRAKEQVEAVLGPCLQDWARAAGRKPAFNYCLANKYEHGSQSVGKHSDDEKDIIPRSATRMFVLEPKGEYGIKEQVALHAGSVLYMGGRTQERYLHSIPKDKKVRGPRISLTFRMNY